jgi:hypothetical protein
MRLGMLDMTIADHIKMDKIVYLRTDNKLKKWAYDNALMLILCFLVVVILELGLIIYGVYYTTYKG